jgi:hypothetical protein
MFPARGVGMDTQSALFVGRVSDVGMTYVILGPTRIELKDAEEAARFQVGHSVSIIADVVDGKPVHGSLVH